ncbi:MAG: cyclic nucleotide-binding domain-containing protein [Chloroflexi bacterium]|nr:cyclic nucleotide-binding domain-containing protein [Chloroflexota bacterium]
MLGTPSLGHSFTFSVTAERLRRSEIFGNLADEDLVTIAEFCREESYQEGDVVLAEDAPAEELFIVVRGKLALEKKIQIGRHSTPRNATIGYIEPGKMAGFSALVTPHVYSTSALCVEPTRVIRVDGPPLRAYLEMHPVAGLTVMSTLAALTGDRYRHATDTLAYFLSIVSHELRSPLAAIENYLQTMLGGFAGELNEKQQRMVKRSILRVTDLRALIGDVVDLARMRPEQIQADFEWFDPGEVGTESIEDVRLTAAEKGVRIKVEPPEKFEPIVGARRRMRQVLTNLLSNAIKFAPPHSVVTFRAWYECDKLYFEVEDQGPGIPPDDMPHIFEDFFRGDNAGETPGAGLGLSIAKKIMEAHNGKILVKNLLSESESGTRFTVVIPRNLETPEMRRRAWASKNGTREPDASQRT